MPLSSVLRDVNVRSVVYCLSDFSAPWGFAVDRSPVAKFHVLLAGTAWLTVGDATPVPLATGDLVLLPHGDGHVIADQPASPVRPLDAILADHPVDENGRLSYGGDGSHTRLLCGGFELRPPLPDDLAEFLPPVLTLDAETGLVRWLEPLFALLKDETQASAPGAAAIFAKLADVFVTQALRSYLAAAGGQADLPLPVVPDPDIARIVKMIRARPRGPVERRRHGPVGRDVQDLVQRQVPRRGRPAADDLPHRASAAAGSRLPVDDDEERAAGRSSGRLRQRGVVLQGLQPALRPAAR